MKETFNKSYIGLRKDLLKFINGSNLVVLDVGCATGINGKYLKDNNIAKDVVGVEYDTSMANVASESIDTVFCGDLNDINFRKEIQNFKKNYDYIIFGDILEHLLDPIQVLGDFKDLLSINGKVIISVPNIGHLELFIQVFIKGKWPQNERGIFDKTHLRWFTYTNVIEMINECDLKLDRYDPSTRARDTSSTYNWKLKLLKLINPKWFIFQHQLVCSKK